MYCCRNWHPVINCFWFFFQIRVRGCVRTSRSGSATCLTYTAFPPSRAIGSSWMARPCASWPWRCSARGSRLAEKCSTKTSSSDSQWRCISPRQPGSEMKVKSMDFLRKTQSETIREKEKKKMKIPKNDNWMDERKKHRKTERQTVSAHNNAPN